MTSFTEKILCKCGYKSFMIKLKEDTPLCCPICKSWYLFKEIRINENERIDKET